MVTDNKNLSCRREAARRPCRWEFFKSLKITQGHRKLHHSMDRIRVPINVPQ